MSTAKRAASRAAKPKIAPAKEAILKEKKQEPKVTN
jgi:hypothetical protein